MQRRMTNPQRTDLQQDAPDGRIGRHRPQPIALPGCMQGGTPLFDARLLTGGGSVAHITLDEQLYVLRITRAGKLILTK